MKDRMERLIAFPFAKGCVSASSVVVAGQHDRRSKEYIDSPHTVCRSYSLPRDPTWEERAPTSSDNMTKSSFRFTALSKPNVSVALHRLTRSIKNLSQSLGSKEDTEEAQMEIGLPTDVKHVAHVGFDGSVTSEVNRPRNLNNTDFLGFCPVSFAQLEGRLAMCAPLDASRDTKNMPPNAKRARNKAEASMM
ncbi:hypothetical protein L2E82_35960 [Cichorium intybus]|uniref:Uncharacterized protein n=1 Tax=Cichorium intybus TaxID=13427 RepID=A0ACB9BQD2_CICIN|nr:hypothetical protein L2E82_35960 [Cichorium intybus]